MVSLEICRLGFLCQQCNLDNGKKHQKTRCTEVLCVHVPCIWSLCPRAGSSVGQWARRKPLASPEPSGPPPASRGSGTEFIHRVSDARAPSVLHAYKHNPAPTTHWINREKRVFKTHLHRAVVIMAILSVIIKKDKFKTQILCQAVCGLFKSARHTSCILYLHRRNANDGTS